MPCVGILDMNSDGSGDVTSETTRSFLSRLQLNHAYMATRYKISIYGQRRRAGLGEVVRIIERAKRNLWDAIKFVGKNAFVVPDNMLMPYDYSSQGLSLKM
jgi:hypothetical protein